MSGYFRHLAVLARQAPSRRDCVSPFGLTRPPASQAPASQPVPPASEAGTAPAAMAAPLPDASSAQPASPAADVTIQTTVPAAAQPSAPRSPKLQRSRPAPPAALTSEQLSSLGETLAGDLSKLDATPQARDSAALSRSPADPVSDPLATPSPAVTQTARPTVHTDPVPPRARQFVADASSAQADTDVTRVRIPASPRSAALVAAMQPPQSASRLPQVEAEAAPSQTRRAARQLPLEDKGRAQAAPFADSLLRWGAAAPPVGALAADLAAELPAPRSKPDVEVSIGTLNLSTEPARDTPAPARPAPRPQQGSGKGIWSGGRAFTRSYLRRG